MANGDPTARRDRRARRMSPGRQTLCVMSKDPEMPSRAMRVKCWFRPFARKVQLPFKGPPPVPNVAQQPASLGSACESSRFRSFHAASDRAFGSRNGPAREHRMPRHTPSCLSRNITGFYTAARKVASEASKSSTPARCSMTFSPASSRDGRFAVRALAARFVSCLNRHGGDAPHFEEKRA